MRRGGFVGEVGWVRVTLEGTSKKVGRTGAGGARASGVAGGAGVLGRGARAGGGGPGGGAGGAVAGAVRAGHGRYVPKGMRVVELREPVDGAFVAESEEARESPTPEPREARGDVAEAAPVVREARGLDVARRIAPRAGDARLFAPHAPLREYEEVAVGRAREALAGRTEAYNDSTVPVRVWTEEGFDLAFGEEGNRWGYTPGRIHLGKRSLPFGFELAGAVDALVMVQEFQNARRHLDMASAKVAIDERIRAIRERAEREREKRKLP